MAVDPGITVDGGPASTDNLVPPNGAAFKLTTPLAAGQTVELPARIHVGSSSGPGRIRLGASASGHYGDGPLAVPTAGDVAVDGPLVSLVAPPGPTIRPVGGQAPPTGGGSTPAGRGGRQPARTSAGVTGTAGQAASAAPVPPASSTVPTAPAPGEPTAPAPTPAPPVTVTAPTQAPSSPAERAATPAPKGAPARHERRPWVGAATLLLLAVGAAVVARLAAGRGA
jgi:hypothetical protein